VVYGVAWAVLGDRRAAEDAAQRCFEQAWRRAASYDPCRGGVRTWLVTIARNVAVDAARGQRTSATDPTELLTLMRPVTDTPERGVLAAETGEELRAALARLPVEQARAVVLAAVHGRTANEIAEHEDVPLGTAKTRIRAGLAKLNRTLADREPT
jgi:RNA polymerase sigma-70 factor (ECF subfamily)